MRVFQRRAWLATPLLVLAFSSQPADAAKKRAGPVPPSMQGVWAVEAKDCDNSNGESRLVIDDSTFLFFVTAYGIKRMDKRRDGTWRASGTRADEGEAGKTPASITIQFVTPDKIKVTGSGSEDQEYDRCKSRSSALSSALIR